MKVLITGINGQLGKMLVETKPKGINVIPLDRKKLDFHNPENCYKKILELKPEWIINCAAYTLVDQAEKNINEALTINAYAVNEISKAAIKIGAKLIQISTDFVFDGEQNFPYKPYQKCNPINIYGKSKSLGENFIINNSQNYLQSIILRTGWLIGPYGENFALKILKMYQENKVLKVVSDQIGSPTSTTSVSNLCWEIIQSNKISFQKNSPTIIHWSDAGIASWYDLAYAVGEIGLHLGLIKKNAKVLPIYSSSYPTPAKRPKYSVLDCSDTYKLTKLTSIHWRKSLYQILNSKNINQI